MALNLDDGLFTVVEFQHVKPGKGGAFVRTKLKNVRTGAVLDRTFRAGEKVEQAIIDKREMQFLYRDGDDYVFMDNETYDQLHVAPAALGDAADYLVEGDDRRSCTMYEDEIVGVELPAVGRARRHRDRAGRAGRPRVGRPQAGHARDRPRRAGAAVRRTSATGSRSTPAPASTSPGSDAIRDELRVERRREARERALALLYEAEAKDVTAERGPRRAAGRARPVRSRAREGRRRHDRNELDELIGAVRRRAGPSSGCRRSTARCCASACFELLYEPDVPDRRGHQRGGRAGQAVLHRRLRPLRQRRASLEARRTELRGG